MLCGRCGGLLMQNWWDSKESIQERMPSTRCVNCGCIDDPVMRANRRETRPARITATQGSVVRRKSSLLSELKPVPSLSRCPSSTFH